MGNMTLWILWGLLYITCGIGGCVSNPEGIFKILFMGFSFIFFVPPTVLLYRSVKLEDKITIKIIRNLSFGWLTTTLVLILLNIASVLADQLTGQILYYTLVILSSPLVCGQIWLIPLFLFSCLMIASHKLLKKQNM